MTDKWEPLSSSALSVCQNLVKKSEQTLFYTVELHSDPVFMRFVQLLHASAIQTIVITHHSKLTSSVSTYQSKNLIFIVNDINELFSLIFYTISEPSPFELNCKKSSYAEWNRPDCSNHSVEILPRICLKIDDHFLWFEERQNCGKIIEITSAELEDGSTLSDHVFNATHGLYVNKIWNSKNHLIFVLKNAHQKYNKSEPSPLETLRNLKFEGQTIKNFAPDMRGRIAFCFKFFWRFFKGRKTIICHPQGCEKYDAFTENLISLQNETDGNFLDFSLKNMHGKPVKVWIDNFNIDDANSLLSRSTSKWFSLHEMAIEHFGSSVNCSVKYHMIHVNEINKCHVEVEGGLKYGVDLHLFGASITSKISENLSIDYLVSLDTSAVCFAAPHSGFMSQGLVIFKSFSPMVWFLTLCTIFTFSLIQYVFQYTQCTLFSHLYSEAQREHIRGTSSMLTIFAYFVCGSPPSLNLGRLTTGNILFSIFSFSTIIISTAFLGSMTTLLSNQVQYPEINSLKTLEESDLYIQISLGEESVSAFGFQNLSESLQKKLVNNYANYWFQLYTEFSIETGNYLQTFLNSSSKRRVNISETVVLEGIYSIDETVLNNMRSIMATDAFVVKLPFTSNPRESVIIGDFYLGTVQEYHLVRECVLTHPVIFLILKNSLFFDELNRVYAHLLETGHAKKLLEDSSDDPVRWGNYSGIEDNGEPRVYNLNDLQSAFIGLIVGLFLSFLAFVGELTIDKGYFYNCSVVKSFRRV
ncbi:unnamed protein product [Bemisia tabaci]|uniref:Ionotropic glutamate receptor C-terminal domain-containing protein n=1 Tax=Bemisia tabaci TaxID=7038 RepID=A0A9P0ALA0_BEMTA|nr:unnamed protein product [Bemisia tabaci]